MSLDEILRANNYDNFTIIDEPITFREKYKGIDKDRVEVHSIYLTKSEDITSMVGYCGVFKWRNNELQPIDYDSYNDEMIVLAIIEDADTLIVFVDTDW